MKHLAYRENELHVEDVKALDITEEMFTPFYVYSKGAILKRISDFKSAFEALEHIVAYSAKALSNVQILRIMADEGLHIQVAGPGEFTKALAAGFGSDRIIFGGPAKTDEELSKAIYEKPLLLQVDSIFELEALKEITEQKKTVQDVGIRLNLGISAGERPFRAEDGVENKFGIRLDSLDRLLEIISQAPGLKLKCVGAHLGSQITSIEPYIEASNSLVDIFLQAKAAGHEMEYLSIGGGLGIDYEEGESFDVADLAAEITPILKEIEGKVIFEPGRFLVGDSGLLITQVLGVKHAGDQAFVFVDAGINDLMRTSIYEAYHEMIPLVIREAEEITADIVGPVSDIADVLGHSRPMIRPRRGEFLAFLNTGAYCSSMASNYCGRRRAAEVLVDGDDFTVIRHRESWEDLHKDDVID